MLKHVLTLGMLKGKRTIIAASVIAVLTFLKMVGILDEGQYVALTGFLTSVGLLAAANHDNSHPV